ncbi:MAG TPA: helix-hairpin-helix domain-containing protein [Steroidobacteraceae bacterium]|nr:helix-hairpin-helix domain-containing protein [Steroidobacteraceae bacterium]
MGREDNARYADRLREAADLLEAQGANPFRVSAYRKAADMLRDLPEDIAARLERGGRAALEELPHIGRGIAAALLEMIRTGRWTQLERLRGGSDPAQLFTAVPGLGHRLAERIHEELHIDTLEGLEAAAYDGRLESVPGVGPRRAASIRSSLQTMLARTRPRRSGAPRPGEEPEVATLLDVDHEYREKSAAGDLPTIAPKRFNPTGTAWLPVLHTTRDGWHFTALFSNTAQAHQLDRTRDWVVVYFYDEEHAEGQHTVVTETHGPLIGRRVVRGREADCRRYYER